MLPEYKTKPYGYTKFAVNQIRSHFNSSFDWWILGYLFSHGFAQNSWCIARRDIDGLLYEFSPDKTWCYNKYEIDINFKRAIKKFLTKPQFSMAPHWKSAMAMESYLGNG